MAQILVTPTLSVSPAGAGTCTYSSGTSGSFSGHQTSAFQNYVFEAHPAAGWHFSHFVITTVYNYTSTHPQDPSADDTATSTTTINVSGDPWTWTSPLSRNGAIVDQGGAYWWQDDYGWEINEGWISAISVTAVFTQATGQLVYSANQGGQLVYSSSQGGALVYDG